MRPLAALRPAMAVSQLVAKRSFVSSTAKLTFTTRAPVRIQREGLRQEFRRYASGGPEVTLSPTPKPKKRFRFLRFLWRVTYLGVIGGTAYGLYAIYQNRHPGEQADPDPTKKTLVVLGECISMRTCHASGAVLGAQGWTTY